MKRRPIEIPADAALVRDRRTSELFLARELHVTAREVTFVGQLLHEDFKGVRLYPPRPRRLTRSRAQIVTSEGVEL